MAKTKNKIKHSLSWPRRMVVNLAIVLLCLVVLGCLVFTTGHDRIVELEYPQKYQEYVEYYAGKYDIDPLLLYAVIRTESNFNPEAQSNAGARGLMQITEVTFDWIKSKIAPTEELTFDSLYDPETNIRFGTYFLSYCLLRYDGDVATAAAAYHSGWGTVDELLDNSDYSKNGVTLDEFPYTQMRLYVKKITSNYSRYQEIYSA